MIATPLKTPLPEYLSYYVLLPCFFFPVQFLEGVASLRWHKVTRMDLKLDSVVVDVDPEDQRPRRPTLNHRTLTCLCLSTRNTRRKWASWERKTGLDWRSEKLFVHVMFQFHACGVRCTARPMFVAFKFVAVNGRPNEGPQSRWPFYKSKQQKMTRWLWRSSSYRETLQCYKVAVHPSQR